MIGVIFEFGTEHVEVRVKDSTIFFRNSQFMQFADIDGIKFDKSGVMKEFPDLKDNKDWQTIAKQRFKEKIKNMKSEKEIVEYIIQDLTKFGYKPLYYNREGFRPIKLT